MEYTITFSIPEIDALRRDIDALKTPGSIPICSLKKEWYSLKELAAMVSMPYSTFRQNPHLHPETSYKPNGKRAVYHNTDVEAWLDGKRINKE